MRLSQSQKLTEYNGLSLCVCVRVTLVDGWAAAWKEEVARIKREGDKGKTPYLEIHNFDIFAQQPMPRVLVLSIVVVGVVVILDILASPSSGRMSLIAEVTPPTARYQYHNHNQQHQNQHNNILSPALSLPLCSHSIYTL